MNIVHVASEVQPFSSTSSISEFTGSLPRSFALSKKHNVSVMSPLYSSIDIVKNKITTTGLKTWVDVGYKVYEYEIFETKYKNVNYLFFKNDELFNRIGLYSAGIFDYSDNDIRFGTFCQAVMNYIKYHDIPIDILHAHNWQASLIPIYKTLHYNDLPCKTVLTIHTVDSLGVFNKFSLETLNLPWDIYNISYMEYYDNISFLKGGIIAADYLTTVSPTFTKELISNDLNLGLDGLFAPYVDKFSGILSGVSENRWNPETDIYLKANYSTKDISGKALCKEAVCKENNLDPKRPLIIFASRLLPAKGTELILESIEEFEKLNCNLLIVSNNASDYHNIFQQLSSSSKNIRFQIGYFKECSHNMLAGADMILAPSLYEPSCIILMIAQKYGVIPIARSTGAALDSVKQAHDLNVGFLFEDFTKEDMMNSVQQALKLYNSTNYSDTVKKIMQIDNTWTKATKEYEKLYLKILTGGQLNESI